MCARKSSRGFTLIELGVTVAIVGLLAGIAVPTVELVAQRNKEQELRISCAKSASRSIPTSRPMTTGA
jgi:prepilin-type N-terminal cleavage/methylation domain-containing protein